MLPSFFPTSPVKCRANNGKVCWGVYIVKYFSFIIVYIPQMGLIHDLSEIIWMRTFLNWKWPAEGGRVFKLRWAVALLCSLEGVWDGRRWWHIFWGVSTKAVRKIYTETAVKISSFNYLCSFLFNVYNKVLKNILYILNI